MRNLVALWLAILALLAPAAPAEPAVVSPASAEEAAACLEACIISFQETVILDVSGAGLSQRPDLDIKNIYFSVLSGNPALKYAYDMETALDGGRVVCTFSYMPYKTGRFPAGFSGAEAGSAEALIALAEQDLASASTPVRITDQTLDPDSINRALQQAGGGYIVCTLNQDGTAILRSPAPGMDMGQCLDALAQSEALAADIAAGLLRQGMSDREKALALYAYVTENVRYDWLYYSDKAAMPYASQTALGALKDGVAICGGYSHAVKLLFTQAGIPCYTETGSCRGEAHMWNVACLDGEWFRFDATADRGLSAGGLRHFAMESLDPKVYTQVTPLGIDGI